MVYSFKCISASCCVKAQALMLPEHHARADRHHHGQCCMAMMYMICTCWAFRLFKHCKSARFTCRYVQITCLHMPSQPHEPCIMEAENHIAHKLYAVSKLAINACADAPLKGYNEPGIWSANSSIVLWLVGALWCRSLSALSYCNFKKNKYHTVANFIEVLWWCLCIAKQRSDACSQ